MALRWTALDPVDRSVVAFRKINLAQNWTEFTTALRDYVAPAQNFVYADSGGNIGYYAAGTMPMRKAGDGSLPAEGTLSRPRMDVVAAPRTRKQVSTAMVMAFDKRLSGRAASRCCQECRGKRQELRLDCAHAATIALRGATAAESRTISSG